MSRHNPTRSDNLRRALAQEAARIMARAADDEILVSETTRALALTSGVAFEDRGSQTLKGLPGDWHLFAYSGGKQSG